MELNSGISDLLDPVRTRHLEQDILPSYIMSRRWFSSKDKIVKSVSLSHGGIVSLDGADIFFAELTVEVGQQTDRYQLPLGICSNRDGNDIAVEQLKLADLYAAGRPAILTDAFSLDALPLGILAAMTSEKVFSIGGREIQCLPIANFKNIADLSQMDIVRLSAEQSNSSLVVGSSIIMKLIRRIMPGINPEVEMVRYLTENSYANTPPLLGEVRCIRDDGSSYSMFVLQKFVSNQGDAWRFTLDYLADEEATIDVYDKFASTLGTRLAQLHEVLAMPTNDASFSPRIAESGDISKWVHGVVCQLELAVEVLKSAHIHDQEVNTQRAYILNHYEEISLILPKLGRFGLGATMTRIHGDFHLGQVLVVKSDAYIIDFEGEPSKPLDLRRQKASPLRDVAGLLRSIDYAGGSSNGVRDDFVGRASGAFLSAYRKVHHETAYRWSTDRRQEDILVELFLLEKCAYEVCYEAANRPSWLPIPLRGLTKIFKTIIKSAQELTDA